MNDLHWPSTPAPGAWRQEAACREHPTDLFFPENGEWSHAAKAICRSCPVIEECRAYAQAQPVLYGIWAGEGVDARRRRGRRARISESEAEMVLKVVQEVGRRLREPSCS